MKKIYVKPVSKVREMETADGILSVTSVDNLDNFFNEIDDEVKGEGTDFAREHKGNTNIWDQGW